MRWGCNVIGTLCQSIKQAKEKLASRAHSIENPKNALFIISRPLVVYSHSTYLLPISEWLHLLDIEHYWQGGLILLTLFMYRWPGNDLKWCETKLNQQNSGSLNGLKFVVHLGIWICVVLHCPRIWPYYSFAFAVCAEEYHLSVQNMYPLGRHSDTQQFEEHHFSFNFISEILNAWIQPIWSGVSWSAFHKGRSFTLLWLMMLQSQPVDLHLHDESKLFPIDIRLLNFIGVS